MVKKLNTQDRWWQTTHNSFTGCIFIFEYLKQNAFFGKFKVIYNYYKKNIIIYIQSIY